MGRLYASQFARPLILSPCVDAQFDAYKEMLEVAISQEGSALRRLAVNYFPFLEILVRLILDSVEQVIEAYLPLRAQISVDVQQILTNQAYHTKCRSTNPVAYIELHSTLLALLRAGTHLPCHL